MRYSGPMRGIVIALGLASAPAAATPATGPVTERERFEADQAFRNRQFDAEQAYRNAQLAQAERDLTLRSQKQAQEWWFSPLILAVLGAIVAAFAQIRVASKNAKNQADLEDKRATETRTLEKQKADNQIALEDRKSSAQLELEERKAKAQRELDAQQAESDRILEAVKTGGDAEASASNLKFLLDAGLITSENLVARLGKWLASRKPGEGPSLPSADGRFSFDRKANFPPEAQSRLAEVLNRFCRHLDEIGFVRPEHDILIDTIDEENAYYDVENRKVFLGPSFRDDPIPACHEYMHHVLRQNAPPAGEEDAQSWALEEGLADYFPCSFLNNPNVGEGFARTHNLPLGHIRSLTSTKGFADLGGKMLDDGAIWGSLLWELRATIGKGSADRLVREAWTSAKWPEAQSLVGEVFVRSLLDSAAQGSADQLTTARRVLAKRGFPINAGAPAVPSDMSTGGQ